jgi:mxaC protein
MSNLSVFAMTIGGLTFTQPWWLAALVLTALPLIRRREDEQVFAWNGWLPPDPLGRWRARLETTLAMLAIAATVLGLAGVGSPETTAARIGSGAEILVLLDRSGSMDDALPDKGVQPALLSKDAEPKKRKIARRALAEFAAGRPHDMFGLMMFSENQFQVMPFNMRPDIIQGAIQAGSVGSGLGNTDVGSALLAASGRFDERPITGSRIILLVSDGGAHITQAVREQIADSLKRNRITLYWIYLRSFNQPGLANSNGKEFDQNVEVLMHRFFTSLPTPYRVFEAENQASMGRAIEAVSQQQMLPITYQQRLPGVDHASLCFLIGGFACATLLLMRSTTLSGGLAA